MVAPVTEIYFTEIARRESGEISSRLGLDANARYSMTNSYGYLGKYQLGTGALADAGFYSGPINRATQNWVDSGWTAKANVYGVYSSQDFLGNPAAQEAAMSLYTDKNWGYVTKLGLDQYVGQVVGSVTITAEGLLAGSHLVGIGATKAFVTQGVDRKDANGTSVQSYMKMFAPESGSLTFAQDTAARTAAAEQSIQAQLQGPTVPTPSWAPTPVETYTYSSSYKPPTPTDSTESIMCRASDYSSSSTSSESPIVIDLNGDGVQLNPLGTSHASFDFDNDGYREATAWASAQDGILVIDEGGDGVVTQAREIAFSQWTAATGDTDLQALAATFDSNHDGVLDANDARFSDFKVWRDANGDGVSDAGEMQTLTQAGIQSMNLTVKSGTDAMLTDGTQVFGLTDVQRTDGSIVQAADVAFAYNKAGYRTRTDSGGNTVYEFESGTTLNYRNIAATATGAAANFNQDTDADANQIAIKKIAVCAVMTGVESRFGIDMVANAQIFWRVA